MLQTLKAEEISFRDKRKIAIKIRKEVTIKLTYKSYKYRLYPNKEQEKLIEEYTNLRVEFEKTEQEIENDIDI